MSDFTYTRNFHLDCFLLDNEGKASLVTYFNLMQEVALKHANILGFGFEDMTKNNMIWVLTRMGLKISKVMKWDEVIKIKTWSRGIDGAFSFREFQFYDEADNLIGTASSSWVPINISSRKPVKVFDNDRINKIAHHESVNLELKKIHLPEKLELGLHHQVQLTDLDINNHANNAKYVEWIYNALSSKKLHFENDLEFHINYLGEAKLNDQIKVCLSDKLSLNKEIYFKGIELNSNKNVFSAYLKIN